MKLVRVKTNKDIVAVSALADQIWHEHFVPIFGVAKVEYMLEKFQKPDAIKRYIQEEGYCYFMIETEGEPAGYLAYKVTKSHGGETAEALETPEIYLSKLYVKKEARGMGAARLCIDHIYDLARNTGIKKIRLDVNRDNDVAIKAYQQMGFEKVKYQKTDIGGGFFMDALIMEAALD